MAQKLIKINQDHYVVVDDSEITQACYVYKSHENVHGRGIFYLPADTDFVAFNKEAKDISVITHSTQPLEIIKGIGENSSINYYYGTDQLSLQEVKELIGEVDVEKKAESYAKDGLVLDTPYANGLFYGYIKGYTQALEDNKEKKYTEEDMWKAFEYGKTLDGYDWFGDLLESLQLKTEWEVEVVDGKLKLKL